MKKKNIILFPGLIILIFITSCETEYVEPIKVSPNEKVSFSLDIQPIFNGNCVFCHPGSDPLDLTEKNSYDHLWNHPPDAPFVDTANPALSILYERMTNTGSSSGPMPPSGILSSTKTSLVLRWIEEGAKDN